LAWPPLEGVVVLLVAAVVVARLLDFSNLPFVAGFVISMTLCTAAVPLPTGNNSMAVSTLVVRAADGWEARSRFGHPFLAGSGEGGRDNIFLSSSDGEADACRIFTSGIAEVAQHLE
jgi:hypothetical protein